MRRCSEPEDLFETISQTLLNAVDRDAYSGWGAMVTIMCVISFPYLDRPLTASSRTPDKVITRTLKGRMD
jgi:20S proteasome subunit beta 3